MLLPIIMFLTSLTPLAPSADAANPSGNSTSRPVVTTYSGLQKMAGIRAGSYYTAGQDDQVCLSNCIADLNDAYAKCGGASNEYTYACQEAADREYFHCTGGCWS